MARLAQLPQPMAALRAVLAQSGDGRTLARATFTLPPGARTAEAAITLPPELRNRLARLVLEGPASAAGVVLLDERWRRRPVGLMSARRSGQRAALGHALLPATRARALCRAARGQHRDPAQAADRGDRARRRAVAPGAGADRADPMGREGRAAGALRRPAHRRGGAGDDPAAAPSERAASRAAAGDAAGRRPPARRRAVLGEAGAPGAVPVRLAVRRAGGAGGRDREPAGAGRALGAAGARGPGRGSPTARRW